MTRVLTLDEYRDLIARGVADPFSPKSELINELQGWLKQLLDMDMKMPEMTSGMTSGFLFAVILYTQHNQTISFLETQIRMFQIEERMDKLERNRKSLEEDSSGETH